MQSQRRLIGTCAAGALVLLASFYSVVDGAVHRAAQHRLAALDQAAQSVAAPVTSRAVVKSPALLARIGN